MVMSGDVDKARERVEELRGCVRVWRGTSEERARGKWVDELEVWVEDLVADVRRAGSNEGGGKGGRDGGGGFLRRLKG